VAKKKNYIIVNMERSMLRAVNFSSDYWDEVVAYLVYILNRSPTIRGNDKLPQEAWRGIKVNVSYFKTICAFILNISLKN
jgi:hypothetical protein